MAAFDFTAVRGLSLLGDEVGAWMADTTEETLVGSELAPDLTGYADQAAAVSDGWILGTGWTFDAANDEFDKATGSASFLKYPLTTTIGEPYLIITIVANGTTGSVITQLEGTAGTERFSNGTFIETLLCSTTNADLEVYGKSTFDGSVKSFAIRLADPDLSANGNGLGVHGSIDKLPVEDGSGLMGYSGFSASDYLEQPYNSALDFGTGDFCYMGVIQTTEAAQEVYMSRDEDTATDRIAIYKPVSGLLQFYVESGGTSIIAASTERIDTGESIWFAYIRRSGVLYLYINGTLNSSGAMAQDITFTTNQILQSGADYNYQSVVNGSLYLWRVFDYAPTSAQIKSIYDKEKHLFKKHSYYTQEGEDYSFDLVLAAATPSMNVIKTDNISLGGQVETILDRTDDALAVTTDLMHRTDSVNYVRTSEFNEFLYSTQASEEFTLDLYGTVASADEPETYIRTGNSTTLTRTEGSDIFTGQFNARKT